MVQESSSLTLVPSPDQRHRPKLSVSPIKPCPGRSVWSLGPWPLGPDFGLPLVHLPPSPAVSRCSRAHPWVSPHEDCDVAVTGQAYRPHTVREHLKTRKPVFCLRASSASLCRAVNTCLRQPSHFVVCCISR